MEYLLPRLRGLWRHLGGRAARRRPRHRHASVPARRSSRPTAASRAGASRSSSASSSTVARTASTQRQARAAAPASSASRSSATRTRASPRCSTRSPTPDVLVEDKLFATLDCHDAQARPAGGPRDHAHRHGRLHQQAAARAGGGVQVHARRGPRGRPAAARRRRRRIRSCASRCRGRRRFSARSAPPSHPQLLVFNKTDADRAGRARAPAHALPGRGRSSRRTGDGLDALRRPDRRRGRARGAVTLEVLVPYTRGELVQLAHEHGADHLARSTRRRTARCSL